MQQQNPSQEQYVNPHVPQQMVVCPVQYVYEAPVFIPPEGHPQNQAVLINVQNPPPWIQSRANQIVYVQQMPNQIQSYIHPHMVQNQMYQQLNYQMPQQLLTSSMTPHNIRPVIEIPTVIPSNMVQNQPTQISAQKQVDKTPVLTQILNQGVRPSMQNQQVQTDIPLNKARKDQKAQMHHQLNQQRPNLIFNVQQPNVQNTVQQLIQPTVKQPIDSNAQPRIQVTQPIQAMVHPPNQPNVQQSIRANIQPIQYYVNPIQSNMEQFQSFVQPFQSNDHTFQPIVQSFNCSDQNFQANNQQIHSNLQSSQTIHPNAQPTQTNVQHNQVPSQTNPPTIQLMLPNVKIAQTNAQESLPTGLPTQTNVDLSTQKNIHETHSIVQTIQPNVQGFQPIVQSIHPHLQSVQSILQPPTNPKNHPTFPFNVQQPASPNTQQSIIPSVQIVPKPSSDHQVPSHIRSKIPSSISVKTIYRPMQPRPIRPMEWIPRAQKMYYRPVMNIPNSQGIAQPMGNYTQSKPYQGSIQNQEPNLNLVANDSLQSNNDINRDKSANKNTSELSTNNQGSNLADNRVEKTEERLVRNTVFTQARGRIKDDEIVPSSALKRSIDEDINLEKNEKNISPNPTEDSKKAKTDNLNLIKVEIINEPQSKTDTIERNESRKSEELNSGISKLDTPSQTTCGTDIVTQNVIKSERQLSIVAEPASRSMPIITDDHVTPNKTEEFRTIESDKRKNKVLDKSPDSLRKASLRPKNDNKNNDKNVNKKPSPNKKTKQSPIKKSIDRKTAKEVPSMLSFDASKAILKKYMKKKANADSNENIHSNVADTCKNNETEQPDSTVDVNNPNSVKHSAKNNSNNETNKNSDSLPECIVIITKDDEELASKTIKSKHPTTEPNILEKDDVSTENKTAQSEIKKENNQINNNKLDDAVEKVIINEGKEERLENEANAVLDERIEKKTPIEILEAKNDKPKEGKRNGEMKIFLTHVLDGHIIQESDVAFPIIKPSREKENRQDSRERRSMRKLKKTTSQLSGLDIVPLLPLGHMNHNIADSKEQDDIQPAEPDTNEVNKDNPFAQLEKCTVQSWTMGQLTSHLLQYDWRETATKLLEEEIDGESLLLVSRDQLLQVGICEAHADVITAFNVT